MILAIASKGTERITPGAASPCSAFDPESGATDEAVPKGRTAMMMDCILGREVLGVTPDPPSSRVIRRKGKVGRGTVSECGRAVGCRLFFAGEHRLTSQVKLLGKPVPSVRGGVQRYLLLGRVDKFGQSKAVLCMCAELLATRHDRHSRLLPLICVGANNDGLGVCVDHVSVSVSDCSRRPAKAPRWTTPHFSAPP
jgi:hypothetical protein